jgi:hypothetical protein
MHITVVLLVLVLHLFFQLPVQSNECSYRPHALAISPEDYFTKYGIQLKSSKDYIIPTRQHKTLARTAIAVTEKWIDAVCPQCTSAAQNTYHHIYYLYVYIKLETRYYLRLLLDMLRDSYNYFHHSEHFSKQFESRPNHETVNTPDHAKNIDMIINRLSSQHYDARTVQRYWVDESFAFSDHLAIYLKNQIIEWNKLIELWHLTTENYDGYQYNKTPDHKQKLDLLVLDHDWKMVNHSMNQLYKQQYRQILDLKTTRCIPTEYPLVNIRWSNALIFDQLCHYLNSIHSANLYDTQFHFLQNLKIVHKDVYLKIYNSYTSLKLLQNRQLASFRTVNTIDIEEWTSELLLLLGKIWKDGPNQTLPLWFLKSTSYWDMIKIAYRYLLDCIYEFFLIRLENYAVIQKRNLLLNLNVALEHLRNL